MDTLTDEEIVTRIKSGEPDLFGWIIDRYESKLVRYARRFLCNAEDIQDKIQEVFIKAYTNIQSFDTDKQFSPWIYRIAHNTFVNELRRKQKAPYQLFDADTFLPYIVAPETTDNNILQQELVDQMEDSLNKIDEKYRAPLILYFYEEMTYQEISEVLHIPVMTVGVRLKRAKEKLKRQYQDNQI